MILLRMINVEILDCNGTNRDILRAIEIEISIEMI